MKIPRSAGSSCSISSLRRFRVQPFSANSDDFQSPTDTSPRPATVRQRISPLPIHWQIG